MCVCECACARVRALQTLKFRVLEVFRGFFVGLSWASFWHTLCALALEKSSGKTPFPDKTLIQMR